MSTKYEDYPAGENGTAGDERRFKRQKSLPGRELIETFGIVTLEQVEPVCKAQDEADGIIKDIKNSFKNGVKGFSHLVCHQTAETDETSEQKKGDDEVFENNIRIRNPHSHIEDGGIPLGVHVKKAEQGFRVHRIISGGHFHKSPLRENDVIIRVSDTNIGSLSIEEFKEFFWKIRLDIDATIKVTIIRRVDDENEADGGFVTKTLTIHLNVEGDTVEQQTEEESNSSKSRCFKPSTYYMTIQRQGQKMYLCVENDKPSFQYLGTDPQNPKFLWKMQLCQNSSIAQNFLLCNVENKKFLSCEDGDDDTKVLKMCEGNIIPAGKTVSCDRRWFERGDYEGDGKFSLQSLEYKGWFLAVDPETLELKMTRTESDRHFFVRQNVQIAW